MNILAIIPARGGSKRLPRKNILPLAGKPLIVHSIDHAKASLLVRRTVVSTDDDEIQAISESSGVEVVRRPAELAGDEATSESALRHVLRVLRDRDGWQADVVVFLQCTSPIRKPHDIDMAIRALDDQAADSLFSGCRSHVFIWRREREGVRSVNYDFQNRQRGQDLPEEFVENGSIYVFKPWVLEGCNNRLGGKIGIYEMDYWSSFQVDSKEELELCEWLLSRQPLLTGS